MVAKIEQESERRRSGRLVGGAETSKELAEWRRLQWKNLNILASSKGKSGLSATGRAVGKYATFAKTKTKRYLSTSPDYEGGESQGEREPHLRERRESERRHREVRVDSTVKEGRLQGEKGRQAKRAFLGQIGERMIG